MLITPEAGLLNRCGRGWRDLSIVVWPDKKIHSFLHQELDLLEYLYIFVPWEEFLFLFLTTCRPEIGKTVVSPHTHGVMAFGTVPRQCQPSEVHADHPLDGWDACDLERSRRVCTRLEGSPVGGIVLPFYLSRVTIVVAVAVAPLSHPGMSLSAVILVAAWLCGKLLHYEGRGCAKWGAR